MSKNKLSIDFKAFAEYAENLDKLGGDVQAVADQVLQNAHDIVTANIKRDMQKHHRTGKTEKAILDHTKVEWSGSMASIDIGFDLANGGFPSIFLMYGTPRMDKDQQLYDHIYGRSVATQLKKMAETTMGRAIERRLGG